MARLFSIALIFYSIPVYANLSAKLHSISVEILAIRKEYACAKEADLNRVGYRHRVLDLQSQASRAQRLFQEIDELLAPELAYWQGVADNSKPPLVELRGYKASRLLAPLAELIHSGLYSPFGVYGPRSYWSFKTRRGTRRYRANTEFMKETKMKIAELRQLTSEKSFEEFRSQVVAKRNYYLRWEALRTNKSFWKRCWFYLVGPEIRDPCL